MERVLNTMLIVVTMGLICAVIYFISERPFSQESSGHSAPRFVVTAIPQEDSHEDVPGQTEKSRPVRLTSTRKGRSLSADQIPTYQEDTYQSRGGQY